MKADRHFDPVNDLERELLRELDHIAKQLRGKITYNHYGNSEGKSSKTVTIEYNIETQYGFFKRNSKRDRG